MPSTSEPSAPARPRPGRAQEAARNDETILAAAKAVVGADPRASMADIGRAAGVGMSALYRRYPSKNDLLLALLEESAVVYRREIARAYARMAEQVEPATAYGDLLHAVIDADVHAVGFAVPGVRELREQQAAAWDPVVVEHQRLLDDVNARSGLREGVSLSDVGKLMTAVATVRGATPERSRELRHRYLTIVLDGLWSGLPPLPGEAATSADYRAR